MNSIHKFDQLGVKLIKVHCMKCQKPVEQYCIQKRAPLFEPEVKARCHDQEASAPVKIEHVQGKALELFGKGSKSDTAAEVPRKFGDVYRG